MAEQLGKPGLVVGAVPGVSYAETSYPVPPGSSLLVFSDGVYEITQPDGTLWTLEDFTTAAIRGGQNKDGSLNALLETVRSVRGEKLLEDDFSLVRIRF